MGFYSRQDMYRRWQESKASESFRQEYRSSFKQQNRLSLAYHDLVLRVAYYRTASHGALISVGSLGVVAVMLLSIITASYPSQINALTPPVTPTLNYCGVRADKEVERYTGTPPPVSPISTKFLNTGNINSFAFTATPSPRFIVKIGQVITAYDAVNKSVLSSTTLNGTNYADTFAVDDNGNYYVMTQLGGIDKYNVAGNITLHIAFSEPFDRGIYGYGSGANFRVAGTGRSMSGSAVWDANGVRQADNSIIGTGYYNPTTDHIVVVDNGYIRIFNGTGTNQLFYIGTSLQPNDPGPEHFYVIGGAIELPDGRFVVHDATYMRVFSSNGDLLGKISNDTFIHNNGALQFVQRNKQLYYYNGSIYYASGANAPDTPGISALDVTVMNTTILSPQGHPTELNIGAGPFTTAAGNYFPSGTTPLVSMQFYPWWSQVAAGLTGTYTIRNSHQVKANQTIAPSSFNVNIDPTSITNIPINLPSTDPGYYELDIKLKRGNSIIGASCKRYSIGAPGQTIASATATGGDSQTIRIAKATGQKLVRGNLKIDQFIPNGDPNSTAPLVIPSSFDVAAAANAAAVAETGVIYELQIADGSSIEKALVANGTWGARVQELVNHFKQWYHVWEPWNEPNNTYGDGTSFTNNILKPFYNGVKAADPTATVVGGGILGVSTSYWDQMIAAGAINYMDVAGDHPYTGHNRSFEEQGQVEQLKILQARFAAAGKPGIEIYDTESGFWSNGPASYWSQGDKEVRKMILEASIGMNHLSNFQNSACFNDSTVIWGHYCSGVYTTGHIASAQFAALTNDKKFSHFMPTGIPHSYAAVYDASDGNRMVIVWTEDFDAQVVPIMADASSMQIYDQYGKTSTAPSYQPISIGGSVTYIAVPAGKTLSLTPVETYAANKALASSGVNVAATSAFTNTPASRTIDGILTTQGKGNNTDSGISVWTQDRSDTAPAVTLTFPSPTKINRLYIASQGINSVQTGLRSYDVQVDPGDGNFVTVSQVRDEFYNRTKFVSFAAQMAKQVRITNMSVNYSGYGNGLPPVFWPDPVTYPTNDVWIGQTTIYELEAYEPGTVYVAPTPQPVPSTPSPGQAPITTDSGSTTTNLASQIVSAATQGLGLQTPPVQEPDESVAKPSEATRAPSNVEQAVEVDKRRAFTIIGSIGLASVIALIAGYELYRHRRHATDIVMSTLSEPIVIRPT